MRKLCVAFNVHVGCGVRAVFAVWGVDVIMNALADCSSLARIGVLVRVLGSRVLPHRWWPGVGLAPAAAYCARPLSAPACCARSASDAWAARYARSPPRPCSQRRMIVDDRPGRSPPRRPCMGDRSGRSPRPLRNRLGRSPRTSPVQRPCREIRVKVTWRLSMPPNPGARSLHL